MDASNSFSFLVCVFVFVQWSGGERGPFFFSLIPCVLCRIRFMIVAKLVLADVAIPYTSKSYQLGAAIIFLAHVCPSVPLPFPFMSLPARIST
jgi:hypothetical protein